MVDQAKLAASAPDATDAIKLHAGHVQITGENTRQRIDQVRALAEQVVAASDRAATQQNVLAILTLTEQTIQGIDVNLDEQVGPIPGESGVITAYQHAQLMASVPLTAQDSAVVVPTPAPVAIAPTAAPAPAAPVPAVTGKTVEIAIGDNSSASKKLTIAVGTTVVWKNAGQKPHTVTANDGSFTSGNQATRVAFVISAKGFSPTRRWQEPARRPSEAARRSSAGAGRCRLSAAGHLGARRSGARFAGQQRAGQRPPARIPGHNRQ